VRTFQRLQISIRNHEFDPFDTGINHSIDGVAPATAYTDDFYAGSGDGRFVVDKNIYSFAGFA
jgi:hypothetical protein